MKNIFLIVLCLCFLNSCAFFTKKNSKYGYYDIDFNDAWQIILSALHQKGKILDYDDSKGEIVVKIHRQPVKVYLKQVTPGTIEYKVSLSPHQWQQKSSLEFVYAVIKSSFDKYRY